MYFWWKQFGLNYFRFSLQSRYVINTFGVPLKVLIYYIPVSFKSISYSYPNVHIQPLQCDKVYVLTYPLITSVHSTALSLTYIFVIYCSCLQVNISVLRNTLKYLDWLVHGVLAFGDGHFKLLLKTCPNMVIHGHVINWDIYCFHSDLSLLAK